MTLSDENLTYLKRLYDNAPVPIAVADPKNTILYANPLFIEKKYRLPVDDILLKSESLVHLQKDPFRVIELRLKGMETGLYILWALSSETDNTSDNFLTTMSHEIRSPLQSVFGTLELMQTKTDDKTLSPMVKTALNSASDVLDILDDILDLAKINADMFNLDNYEVPIRTLVAGVIEALQIKTIDKPVELEKHIDDAVPAVVKGDPKRLRQVLMNLASNAIKFTEQGHIAIRVENLTPNPNSKHVVLRFEVSDTGIGIPAAAQKTLFNPFTQADSSTSRKYGGTGLGLSITGKLIELMGGQIGVESKENEGSTFWFEIPVSVVIGEQINDSSDTFYKPDLLDGIKILSVEDHPKASLEIKNSLESAGAKVTICKNLVEARKELGKQPFDLGIVDQSLPDGLGIDLIREITRAYPAMEILMYTAREDQGLEYSLQALGANYLAKPASRQGLVHKVRQLVKIDPAFAITGKGRILLVEDTESVAEVFRQQLKSLNITADFASNGPQAIEIMKAKDYDMVVTDFHMPELDGITLTKIIRDGKLGLQTRSNIPVIALSADVSIASQSDISGHLFQEILLKPVTLAQLQRLFIRWGLLRAQDTTSSSEDENSNDNVIDLPSDHIDFDALKERIGDVGDGAKDMLKVFVNTTSPRVDALHTAYDNRDLKRLSELAHSLRGAALSVCAPKLAKLGESLQAINENNFTEGYPILRAIEQEMSEIRRTVDKIG